MGASGSPATAEAHLDAVLHAPEDDALRIALADFLRPYEPERAAFIALQVARSQRERRPNAFAFPLDELPAEERRLLRRNEPAWARGVARYANRVTGGGSAYSFHRGLIAHVGIEPEVFIEHAAQLLQQAPIRHVDFAPLRAGVLPRLLASEALARLDSIGFPGAGLDDDAVAELAGSPRLAQCLYLDLSMNPLGPRAFGALASSPHLRRLLVVDRAQEPGVDAALTWHPGEIVVSEISAARSRAALRPMTEQGRALEESHGELPWLHHRNRVPRFDVRWFVDHGHRPVKP